MLWHPASDRNRKRKTIPVLTLASKNSLSPFPGRGRGHILDRAPRPHFRPYRTYSLRLREVRDPRTRRGSRIARFREQPRSPQHSSDLTTPLLRVAYPARKIAVLAVAPSQDLSVKGRERAEMYVGSVGTGEHPPMQPTQDLNVVRRKLAQKHRRYRRYRRWRGYFTDHTDDTDDKFEREELKIRREKESAKSAEGLLYRRYRRKNRCRYTMADVVRDAEKSPLVPLSVLLPRGM